MRSSSRAQARSPRVRIGWRTVVSGGSARRAGWMSSKPVTATSPGTRIPAAVRARRTPMAIWSLAHTTASGSAARCLTSSSSAACSPLAMLKIPCAEPMSWHRGLPRSAWSRASRRWIASGEFGGALDVPGGGESFADEDPVHLARQGVKAGQFRLAGSVCLHEAAEQQPLAVADPCLHAALYFVVVEQALVLDVMLACLPALDAHHADDVLAAAGQALGGAIGHVAELLDGLLHADPGGLADPVLAVHDARDRRGGDGSPAGDIVESDHGGSVGGVAMFGARQDVSAFSGISAGSS